LSQRQIADVIGVDERTVRRDHDAAIAAAVDQDPRRFGDSLSADAANAAPTPDSDPIQVDQDTGEILDPERVLDAGEGGRDAGRSRVDRHALDTRP
jgi:hypothetical protein